MKVLLGVLMLLLGATAAGQHDADIILDSIVSEVLGEVVPYQIYLPESYHDYNSSKAYPTVYVLDRGDMFELTKTQLAFLAKTGKVPESIVVGLSSSDRIRDYTPTVSTVGYQGEQVESYGDSGGAGTYLHFLEQELIGRIGDGYRTNKFDLLIGHSLSGLFGAYALSSSTSFEGYILIDPSTWWADQSVVNSLQDTDRSHIVGKRVFLTSAGTLRYSDEMARMKNSQLAFTGEMKQLGWPDHDYKFVNYAGDTHGSVPLRSILDGIEWMYAGFLVDDMKHRSAQDIIDNFRAFDRRMGHRFPALEPMVSWLSSVKSGEGNHEEALALAQMNVDNYPDSWKAFYDRGRVHEDLQHPDDARRDYTRSLELDPANTSVINRLEGLGNE